jgi:hypothetical protein
MADEIKSQIMQLVQADPQLVEQVRGMVQELAQDPDFEQSEVDDFIAQIEAAIQNPALYPSVVRQLEKENLVDPGDMPAQFDPGFMVAMLAAFYMLQEQGSAATEQRFAKGGLAQAAQRVRAAGRNGDTILAHINPQEAAMLKAAGGSGRINPATGIPEYGLKKFLKKAFKVVAPIALAVFAPGIGSALGAALGATGTAASVIGNALVNGAVSKLSGGSFGQGALTGAIGGGLGGAVGAGANEALNLGLGQAGQQVLGGAISGGLQSAATGGNALQGALGGALGGSAGALGTAISDNAGLNLGSVAQNVLGSAISGAGAGLASGQGIGQGILSGLSGMAGGLAGETLGEGFGFGDSGLGALRSGFSSAAQAGASGGDVGRALISGAASGSGVKDMLKKYLRGEPEAGPSLGYQPENYTGPSLGSATNVSASELDRMQQQQSGLGGVEEMQGVGELGSNPNYADHDLGMSPVGAAKPQSFGNAFAAARAAGDSTFMWNGKPYTTELASPGYTGAGGSGRGGQGGPSFAEMAQQYGEGGAGDILSSYRRAGESGPAPYPATPGMFSVAPAEQVARFKGNAPAGSMDAVTQLPVYDPITKSNYVQRFADAAGGGYLNPAWSTYKPGVQIMASGAPISSTSESGTAAYVPRRQYEGTAGTVMLVDQTPFTPAQAGDLMAHELVHVNQPLDVLGQGSYNFRKNMAEDITNTLPYLQQKYGYSGAYDKNPAGAGADMAERMADMQGYQFNRGVDFAKDPVFQQQVLSKDPLRAAIWNANTIERSTRLDPRDLPPGVLTSSDFPKGQVPWSYQAKDAYNRFMNPGRRVNYARGGLAMYKDHVNGR